MWAKGRSLLGEMAIAPTRAFEGLWEKMAEHAVAWKAQFRIHETLLLPLSLTAGITSGIAVSFMSWMAQRAHIAIFHIPLDVRLSAASSVRPVVAILAPALGGLVLGLMEWYRRRRNIPAASDPIAANALRGGHLSLRDSLVVSGQTLISNGCGASVGLEAGYAQIGAGIASHVGRFFNLRRNDLRLFMGCGVAGAIGAAFNAPLTGALYACELVIGTYSVRTAGPVLIAALAGVLVTGQLGDHPYSLAVVIRQGMTWPQTVALAGLAVAVGVIAIGVMYAAGMTERAFRTRVLPVWARPMLGGVIVGILATHTPQILAAGHGAMALDLTLRLGCIALLALTVLKSLACVISLGSGFRGGLFFASLFIGSLLGKLYALVLQAVPATVALHLNPTASALVGMAAFGTAVVGGPLTMTFLVLEMTQNFQVAVAALPACIVANVFVRGIFHHSFSTWRLHLQGESIDGADDIGWLRGLTVKSMMRTDVETVHAGMSLRDCRARFALGSHQAVFIVNPAGRYTGTLFLWELYVDGGDADADSESAGTLGRHADAALSPAMNVRTAMDKFESAQADLLPVLDGHGKVIGFLTENYARRRFMQELDGASDSVLAPSSLGGTIA